MYFPLVFPPFNTLLYHPFHSICHNEIWSVLFFHSFWQRWRQRRQELEQTEQHQQLLKEIIFRLIWFLSKQATREAISSVIRTCEAHHVDNALKCSLLVSQSDLFNGSGLILSGLWGFHLISRWNGLFVFGLNNEQRIMSCACFFDDCQFDRWKTNKSMYDSKNFEKKKRNSIKTTISEVDIVSIHKNNFTSNRIDSCL